MKHEIINALLRLLASFFPYLFIQRMLHQELQRLFLVVTRRPAFALGLFSVLFFPGVLLHEASHYLMAKVLWVRTRRLSLIPEVHPDGKMRMGYVEVAKVDIVRNSLVGIAPLLTGGSLIAYLSSHQLDLQPLIAFVDLGEWMSFYDYIIDLPNLPDFWLWFYVALAISSTMLPSPSDRRAWLPLLLVLVGLAALAAVAGAGPWMTENIAPWFSQVLNTLALVFGFSLITHLVLLLPVGVLRVLLYRLTGFRKY